MTISARKVNKQANSVDEATIKTSELYVAQKSSAQSIEIQQSLEGWIARIDWESLAQNSKGE